MYLTLAAAGGLYAAGLLDWMPVEPAAILGQATFLTNYPGLFGTEAVLPRAALGASPSRSIST